MPTPDSRLRERALARHELGLRAARRSFSAFVEYAFGFRLAPHQVHWAKVVEQHRRLVVLAPVEHAKTTLLSIAYPLWRLGNDPNLRIGLVSETHAQATRPLAAIREAIVQNPRVREVFPHLRPASGGAREKWSDSEIVVERSASQKDPSILAVGVLGPLLGARLDLACLDDCVSWETAWTSAQREKTLTWFRSTLVGRVVATGQIIAIGTPWHHEDLLGQLQRSGEYHVVKTPAVTETGKPLWPEVWSSERLEQRRREIGEIEFGRQMLLEVVSDATSRFKETWIEGAFRAGGQAGVTLVDNYSGEYQTFTGVDLGVGQDSHHDESVAFTIAVLPGNRRQVLSIEAGRWTAPELLSRLKSIHQRYRSRLRVESNGAQDHLRQFLAQEGIPVESHHTGRNRHDPAFGIESLAVEFERGQWIVPDAPVTRAWVRELIAFSPTGHPDDKLVASWLAREAARASGSFSFEGLLPVTSRSPPLGEGLEYFVAPGRPGGVDEAMWATPSISWPRVR